MAKNEKSAISSRLSLGKLTLNVQFSGAQAAGNAALAVASGQPETAIEHIDYRSQLSQIRNIYHLEVNHRILPTQSKDHPGWISKNRWFRINNFPHFQ